MLDTRNSRLATRFIPKLDIFLLQLKRFGINEHDLSSDISEGVWSEAGSPKIVLPLSEKQKNARVLS